MVAGVDASKRTPAETIYSQIGRVAREYCAEGESLVLATCGPEEDAAGGLQHARRSLAEEVDPAEPFVTVGAPRTVGSVQGRVLRTQVPTTPLAEAEPLRAAFFGQIEPFLREGAAAKSPLGEPMRGGQYFRRLKTGLEPAGAWRGRYAGKFVCPAAATYFARPAASLAAWLAVGAFAAIGGAGGAAGDSCVCRFEILVTKFW